MMFTVSKMRDMMKTVSRQENGCRLSLFLDSYSSLLLCKFIPTIKDIIITIIEIVNELMTVELLQFATCNDTRQLSSQ